ncbi:hypothetical protein, partial [Kribbella sandramycini]|uniref:hypothetical protein n=1 Tax=Kribbella sandramycini TaxID=60450 RepID=UPI0031D86BC0
MSRAEVAADSPYQFSRPGELAEVVELRPGGTKVPGAETVEPGLAEQAVTGVRQEQKPKIGGAVMEQLVSVGAPRRASRKLQAAPGLGAEGRAADVGAGAAGGGAAAVGAGGGTARAGAAGAGVVGREVLAGVRFAGAMSVGAL